MVKVRHNYSSFDMKLMVLILSSQIAELDYSMRTHTKWALKYLLEVSSFSSLIIDANFFQY